MNILNRILDIFDQDEFLIADGFDDAVIGLDEESMVLIYSISKCLDILRKQGMSMGEAQEHFDFNVSGSYVGEKTPIWCYDTFD